jgi:hypothetical protein
MQEMDLVQQGGREGVEWVEEARSVIQVSFSGDTRKRDVFHLQASFLISRQHSKGLGVRAYMH